MTRVHIFTLTTRHKWKFRQCRICGYIFKVGDKIIRKGVRNNTKSAYYCESCAKLVKLI